jgi:hypothetical protein
MSGDHCGGCCDDAGAQTSAPLDNPPGLAALSYRVGTYRDFFRKMVARLAALQAEQGFGGGAASPGAGGCLGESHRSLLLGGDPDAGTALLDGWACVSDVLTFYQERIANEGYLRTATEERSVIELGHLTGYEPRPGVAASVHLAFSVQDGFDGVIPERTRAQSLPRPDQTAQAFETSHPILCRAEWNAMPARTQATGRYIREEYGPCTDCPTELVPTGRIEIFLDGLGQNVQAGDVLLVERTAQTTVKADDVYQVSNVWLHPESGTTTLRLVPIDGNWSRGGEWDPPAQVKLLPEPTDRIASARRPPAARSLEGVHSGLRKLAERSRGGNLSASPQAALALLAPGMPELQKPLLALMNAQEPEPPPQVHVMRVRAQVFGHAVPMAQEIVTTQVDDEISTTTTSVSVARELRAADDEEGDVVFLDGEFGGIRAGSTLVIRAPAPGEPKGPLTTLVFAVQEVETQSRLAYGTQGKTTRVTLSGQWWLPRSSVPGAAPNEITPIRRALVYAQPEPLSLVGEPLESPVAGATIDLERAVQELPADRLVIVEGELDLSGVSGLRVAEVAKIASSTVRFTDDPAVHVLRDADGNVIEFTPPGDTGARSAGYTRLTLTAPLTHQYRRASVIVRGTVAHATHGETRDEILGSGDASVANQRFTLRAGPRTWEPAPTPSGVASSLIMRVSGVQWPEVSVYVLLGPRDEVVRTRTLSDRKDEILGGDGRHGARFPTGIENLTARYRVGLGTAGNVDAGLINALVTRPIGVREVVNPLASSGGADPDSRDEIRLRIPIVARSIDRLVSVADHADFALNFAGVVKAAARQVGSTIEVVIAGEEDATIGTDSDLLANLRAAFQRYGDPLLRPVVQVATPTPLVLQAGVRIDARHEWSTVEAALRERLLLRLGWDARGIGEPARLSAVLEALQSVDGVLSIDVDSFGPFGPAASLAPPAGSGAAPSRSEATQRWGALLLSVAERLDANDQHPWVVAAGPAQILYFSRTAPDNVVFREVAP